MSDYAVKVSVRNARILRRMREAGFATQAELARHAGLGLVTVNSLITLRRSPVRPNGKWAFGVETIASALGCAPEDLFSDSQREMQLERNSIEVEMSEPQVVALTGGDPEGATWAKLEVQRLLAGLPDRTRYVMEQRMGGATLEEIGDELGVHRSRVGSIEAEGVRKMKGALARSDNRTSFKMLGAKP